MVLGFFFFFFFLHMECFWFCFLGCLVLFFCCCYCCLSVKVYPTLSLVFFSFFLPAFFFFFPPVLLRLYRATDLLWFFLLGPTVGEAGGGGIMTNKMAVVDDRVRVCVLPPLPNRTLVSCPDGLRASFGVGVGRREGSVDTARLALARLPTSPSPFRGCLVLLLMGDD